jgi:hypothetical protein
MPGTWFGRLDPLEPDPGGPQRAARLLAAIQAHLKALGGNMIPVELSLYDQTLKVVQHAFDKDTFNREWAIGVKFNVDEAIALAMS